MITEQDAMWKMKRSRQTEYTAIILQVPFDKEDMYVSKTYYHVRGINVDRVSIECR